MKKENVIELESYREQTPQDNLIFQPISEDLQTAIKDLIHRLRELGPIQQSND